MRKNPNINGSAGVSLLCASESLCALPGMNGPSVEALEEAPLGSPTCMFPLSVPVLLRPWRALGCPLPTCPSNAGPLFWTRPTALDSQNLNLFGFQPLPPGSMAPAFKLSHWWGFWSSNREHLQPHRDHSPGLVTGSTWKLLLFILHPSKPLVTTLLLLRKKDGSCSNKTSVQCCTFNSRFFPVSAPQSHDTQAELCLSDSLQQHKSECLL